MYSLVDEGLKNYSHGALNVFNYKGDDYLVVIKVSCILSVVAMVPFERASGGHRFFVVEKFALGVVHSEDHLDSEE